MDESLIHILKTYFYENNFLMHFSHREYHYINIITIIVNSNITYIKKYLKTLNKVLRSKFSHKNIILFSIKQYKSINILSLLLLIV